VTRGYPPPSQRRTHAGQCLRSSRSPIQGRFVNRTTRHHPSIVVAAALVAGGLVLGLIVGRWWALIAAPIAWLVVALTGDFDGPAWAVGIGMGLLAALGLAVGVLIRNIAKPS
jgi:hypothetical protein